MVSSTVAAAMPGPAMPKARPYNRAYTMPAAAIDAAAATLGAISKAAMHMRPNQDSGSGQCESDRRPCPHYASIFCQPQMPAARPVGQSPHWSIPAPLLPHTPMTPGPPVRVAQADERLGDGAPVFSGHCSRPDFKQLYSSTSADDAGVSKVCDACGVASITSFDAKTSARC